MKFKMGDILRDESEALVNTVNCVGVMGRGIALQFKKAFPRNFEEYKDACSRGLVQPGKMFVFERAALTSPKFIINFPTKRHWRGKSRMEDITSGLEDLRRVIEVENIKSIAIPPLGSGLGGLNWSDVRKRIEVCLGDLNVEVTVYEPGESPDAKVMARTTDAPKMTAGRATLITLMHRYLEGLLDPFVTLVELHKLMYFMQASGEPLRLKYTKHHYGPYAENLRHVLNHMEGHMVSGYADGGDAPDKPLELVPGARIEAEEFLRSHYDTHQRFEKVSSLVRGFESPVGLELLATVHWLIHNEGVNSSADAVAKTYAWNARKRKLTARQIGLAYDRLAEEGWAA